MHTYLLDGDNVRHGLNRDLGFYRGRPRRNIRRVAEVARPFVDAGLIVLCPLSRPSGPSERSPAAALPPATSSRSSSIRRLPLAKVATPGACTRKRTGQLKNFTGIDSPYEPPEAPELRIDGAQVSALAAAEQVASLLANPR